jgi:hypothetical protein
MSKINFLNHKLFSSASVSLVSQCQLRQPVPALSAKRVFCQPFPVLQMHQNARYQSLDFYHLIIILSQNFTSLRYLNSSSSNFVHLDLISTFECFDKGQNLFFFFKKK